MSDIQRAQSICCSVNMGDLFDKSQGTSPVKNNCGKSKCGSEKITGKDFP